MAKAKELWQTISLKPLTGVFDVRSRPADIPAGGFRWRQCWGTSDENKLCRRQGFTRAFPDTLPNGTYANSDLHSQGGTRQPITFLYENTNPDKSRNLYAGNQGSLWIYNDSDGTWKQIITGQGSSGSRWQADTLQGVIVFTNNINAIQIYTISNGGIGPNVDLGNAGVQQAAVVKEFNGVMFLMNIAQSGVRVGSRVIWSDLNDATSWNPANPSSIAGFQDLDYSEQILGAKEMLGSLIIYTDRSIWQCQANPNPTGANSAFIFTRIYTEPKNQIGCLLYPNTLVSTGMDHYYASRDAIYHFSPYLSQPERIDWIHRADGAIYTNVLTKLDPSFCQFPIAEALPGAKELWFSWGSNGFGEENNWTLILNIEQKSADINPFGFTALVNYRPATFVTVECNEQQLFIGASGKDWCLKQIGGAFYLEYATLTNSDITQDIPFGTPGFVRTGYRSILRGLIPLGLTDRDKIVRRVSVDDDVSDQDVPCIWRCRIGHSHKLVDPNDTDPTCTPLWVTPPDQLMQCPDAASVAEMQAANISPDQKVEFPCYEKGVYLYFELTVLNQDGTDAIGGDVCLTQLDFDAMAMPKPAR